MSRSHSIATGTPGDTRWRAVLARDARFDRRFVYAVRSTGVYCRASCPSRRPRRGQVRFFRTPVAAERAGFRACRRCGGRPVNGEDAAMVACACRLLAGGEGERVTLARLASAVDTAPHTLLRAFRRVTGISPRQYAEALRMGRVKAELRRGRDVAGALYEAGFGSSSRLYEKAAAHLGMTPATYRSGGKGMHIRYITTPCPLGRLLVAATDRGISALFLGDTDRPLESALREEFPRAELTRDTNGLRGWVRSIVQHLEGRQGQLDLPLDVQATAFQRRVWEELRRIPYGATRTYTEVARRIGQPSAVRAVARACATNPVSVVVPCHRVVREDGQLAGYRWGLDRKRRLLAQEKAKTA